MSNREDLYFITLSVVRDVICRFPTGIEEAESPFLQDLLTWLVVRVLGAQPALHYYQGYHQVHGL